VLGREFLSTLFLSALTPECQGASGCAGHPPPCAASSPCAPCLLFSALCKTPNQEAEKKVLLSFTLAKTGKMALPCLRPGKASKSSWPVLLPFCSNALLQICAPVPALRPTSSCVVHQKDKQEGSFASIWVGHAREHMYICKYINMCVCVCVVQSVFNATIAKKDCKTAKNSLPGVNLP